MGEWRWLLYVKKRCYAIETFGDRSAQSVADGRAPAKTGIYYRGSAALGAPAAKINRLPGGDPQLGAGYGRYAFRTLSRRRRAAEPGREDRRRRAAGCAEPQQRRDLPPYPLGYPTRCRGYPRKGRSRRSPVRCDELQYVPGSAGA